MSDADESPSPRRRRSPAFLATAVALPVAVLACFVFFAVLANNLARDARDAEQAGRLKSIAAPSAGDAACATLLGALPTELGEFRRDDSADPAGFARWSSSDRGAVEVRCGTERPIELTATAKLQIVNGVQWLQATPVGAPTADGGSYWTAVDHRPYVTLWVPDASGTAAIQAVSDAIAAGLPQASLELGG